MFCQHQIHYIKQRIRYVCSILKERNLARVQYMFCQHRIHWKDIALQKSNVCFANINYVILDIIFYIRSKLERNSLSRVQYNYVLPTSDTLKGHSSAKVQCTFCKHRILYIKLHILYIRPMLEKHDLTRVQYM